MITNNAYRFMVLEQLAEIGLEADVLLEPMRRDSGPAIAAGAAVAQTRDSQAIVLALAADHVVGDVAAFVVACREGMTAAEAGHIVTFGVQPERAATEYGYISPGEAIAGHVRAVVKFVEKPDPATATTYIKSGYLWNSGNFMFRASVLLDEYRNVDAASVQAVSEAVSNAGTDLGFVKLDEKAFGSAKAISIDYAVMEKTSHTAVVPVVCGWSDVGSWHAVWELSDKDGQGNAARGAAVFEDSRNCNVSTDRALVALEGVDDLVVVATQDAVLVSRQKDANGLKRLVAKLKAVAPEVTESHIKVHGRGAPINRSTMAIATRSSASSSSPAAGSRCKSTIIAPNTGSWSEVRRVSPSTNWSRPCTRTNRSTSRSARCTGWKTPARSSWN